MLGRLFGKGPALPGREERPRSPTPTREGNPSRAILDAYFADPWRRYGFGWIVLGAARLYLATWKRILPVAIAIFGLSAFVAGGIVFAAAMQTDLGPVAGYVSLATRSTILLMLALAPFGAPRTIRALVEHWGAPRVRFPRIRLYRLLGTALYLGIPSVVLAMAFPLGLAILPIYFWWMFAPYVVLIEGDGGRTALRRSRTLSVGEFSLTGLPVTVAFLLVFLALTMGQRIVPSPPRGFGVDEEGRYVRPIMEGESYDPVTRILTAPDGRLEPMPEEIVFDEEAGTLTLPAPEPLPLKGALLAAGVPALLAGLFEPIRWYVQALLYFGLRMRREGLRLETLLREIDPDAVET